MSNDQLYNLRHSAAHMLAATVLQLYPGTKLGTGPVIDNGFYYDVLPPHPLTENDLAKIESTMRKIIAGNHEFVRSEVTAAQAKERLLDQPFKHELIDKFAADGRSLTLYQSGPLLDLCEGGHVDNTKELAIVGFKLTKVAGAYWQADANRPQMTRLYGILFESEAALQSYLTQLAEAEKRDHRKLGKELNLFTILDEVGPGIPLFYPKGAALRQIVENFVDVEQKKLGFTPIWVPHIAKDVLYQTSGHLGKYDAMFAPMKLDEHDYYLKPMNCPHFMMLYKSQPHSYRDLPLRWACTTTVYRNEKSGELSGLTRVRCVTQDDCHVFMRPDQIEPEIDNIINLIKITYDAFGLKEFWVSVSTRDQSQPDKYLGKPEVWDQAEATLEQVIAKRGWTYKVVPGEAAFYGPKLDFIAKDAIGREWQLSTVQLDFNLPERFALEYVDTNNQTQRPVVVHRAVMGSVERWLGVMIEHFAGNFPTWLAPVQVKIVSVGEKHIDYCLALQRDWEAAGVRVETDTEAATVGNKIRKATGEKVPYVVVIGDKEMASGAVSVRKRGHKALAEYSAADFVAYIKQQVDTKALVV